MANAPEENVGTWLQDHHGRLLPSLQTLQQDPAFSDLKLCLGSRVAGGEEVAASRLLLASLSPVFYRMLQHDMLEQNEGKIRLECISVAAWETILSFYFGNGQMVTAENVVEIFIIAHMYEMFALTKHCEEVMMRTLSPENCFGRLAVAKLHTLKESEEKILTFARDNFSACCRTQEFLELSKGELLDFLKGPYLTTTEDSLCMGILDWLGSNSTDEETVWSLIGHLKPEDLSHNCLLWQLPCHPQVMCNASIREIITLETERRLISSAPFQLSATLPLTRKPRKEETILVLGHEGSTLHIFEADGEMTDWKSFQAPCLSKYFAACMFDESLYITGGEGGSKSMQIFHLKSRTWSSGPDLQYGRFYHEMVTIGGSMYAVMGRGVQILSSVEEFSQKDRQWKHIGNMQVPSFLCAAAAIEELIITMGGFTFLQGDVVQVFNVRTKTAYALKFQVQAYLTVIRGISLGNAALFVAGNGSLYQVRVNAGKSLSITETKLDRRATRSSFAVLADRHLITFGMGRDPHEQRSNAVDRFTLGGNRLDRGMVKDLPLSIELCKAFRISR